MKYKILVLAISLFCCSKMPRELSDYKIVYNADSEVYIADLDGKNKINLTNHEANDGVMFLIGNKIFFHSDRRRKYHHLLYKLDPFSGGKIEVVNDSLVPVFRDNVTYSVFEGRLLFNEEDMHSNNSLYLWDLKTGQRERITPKNHDIDYSYSILAHDSLRIAFCNCQFSMTQIIQGNIWTSNTSGKDLKQLTFYSRETARDADVIPQYWSKANLIYFTYKSYDETKNDYPKGIYSVSLDGKITQVTPPDVHVDSFSFSPDEKWIVFSNYKEASKSSELFLLNIRDKEIIQITSDDQIKTKPFLIKNPD